MKTVILVSGKLQSGKNLFTDLCMENLKEKYSVSYDYFAKELKNRCKEDFSTFVHFINKISEHLPEDIKDSIHTNDENWYENKNQLTRLLLQLYGTEIFRNRVDVNYWAHQLVKNVKKSNSEIVFITDVRFPSEIEALKGFGFNLITVRINRTITREEEFNQHESELALDNYKKFNHVIENNGTLDELKEKARLFSETIISQIETTNNQITMDFGI